MIYNTSIINAQPLKQSHKQGVSFGNRNESKETSGLNYEEEKEKQTAKKLEKLAQKAKEAELTSSSKIPTALRSIAVVSLLTGASALTAAALGGRFYSFLNEVVKGMSKFTGKMYNGMRNLSSKVKVNPNLGQKTFKGQALKYIDKSLDFLDVYGRRGIETELKGIQDDKVKIIKSLKRAIAKENKANPLSKQQFAKTLEAKMLESEKLINIEKQINELKGSSLTKKGVKISTGVVAGTGALKETTEDRNGDGIPDIAQHKESGKTVTRRVTEALLDTALDS